jgi:2-polyprenyl-3-methyl-5-hydroxy-6-metoxy-1,4-benzoquinol methylase
MENNLTSKEYWVNSYGQLVLTYDESHDISKFLKKYLAYNNEGSCIEIGSYPGHFLPILGQLGYELHGIDFHPLNKTAIPEWLAKEGFKTGNFVSDDFFSFKNPEAYDVVMSFGFIEHFIDFKNVILKHSALVKKDGHLIITTPNFSGFLQHMLHFIFDRKNLKRHNLLAMNPMEWEKILVEEGFQIIYKGNFGKFWFWVDVGDKRSLISTYFIKQIQRILTIFRSVYPANSKHYSAYAGIVAQKIK